MPASADGGSHDFNITIVAASSDRETAFKTPPKVADFQTRQTIALLGALLLQTYRLRIGVENDSNRHTWPKSAQLPPICHSPVVT